MRSCTARESVEALTGERTGWVLSRENRQTPGCRRSTVRRKATRPTTPRRVARSILRGLRPQARSETSGQGTGRSHVRPQVTKNGHEARAVKPTGRPTAMYDHGKSDSCVVPMKSANEASGAPLAEEQMEGRRLANSNSPTATATGLSTGLRLQQAGERVRQAAMPVRYDWRQEPSAVVPLAGIRAGGAG